MIDDLTNNIIQQLNDLPLVKKKAILELIKTDKFPDHKKDKNFKEQWRKELLTTSVWTDAEISEIYKAREYINKWKPQQFF